MTDIIRPFRGLRVDPAAAPRVAAPPYDVMNTEEARELVGDNGDSFLHVSMPEIDFPPGTDPHSEPWSLADLYDAWGRPDAAARYPAVAAGDELAEIAITVSLALGQE